MFKPELLSDPALKKLVVQVPKDQFLFRQNDKGNTMYIIVEGSVRLTQKIGQADRTIGTLGAGEVVGERAICLGTPYKRSCSASAEVDTTVLEFDTTSLKMVQAKAPDFTLKLLALVSSRLERMNRFVGILQVRDSVERVLQYLVYCAEHRGHKVSGGTEITFSIPDSAEAANVTEATMTQIVQELVAEKLVIRTGEQMVIPDEHALIQVGSTLRERIAA